MGERQHSPTPWLRKVTSEKTENYRGITLIAIAAKVYNAFLKCIKSEIETILRKNPNGFRRNQSMTSQLLIIHRIIERVRTKNFEATLVCKFLQGI